MKYLIILLLLPCSFIGLAQKTLPADTIKKKSVVALDSVVVINNGYQLIPRDRSTGSFAQVDNATLNLQVGTNIINRLEAVTPGLTLAKKAGMPSVTVRGISTISGPTAPLIILDNFPYEGDINAINPAMIESVTILKDATAASIWGTRAGNGVIVINTKKGKYNQPFTIDFSSSVQTVAPPAIDKIPTIAPADFIGVEQMLFSKGYYNSQLSSTAHPNISPVVEILDRQAKGLITPADAAARIDALKNNDIKKDLANSYYSNALNRQYAISFSGGSSISSWLAAGGYDYNRSALSEKYERKTLRMENSFTLFNNLKLTTGIYYAGTNTKTGKDNYATQEYMYPYSSLYDAAGKPAVFGRDLRLSYTDTLGAGRLLDWGYYPTEDYKYRYTTVNSTNLVLNFAAQYTIGKGFSAELKYQSEQQHAAKKTLYKQQSYQARYFVNQYSQINYTTGQVTYNLPPGGILDISNSDTRVNNYRAQLNYSRTWNRHRLNALGGTEIREVLLTDEGYRTYGYNDELGIGTITDLKTRYPYITTGELQQIPSGENLFSTQLRRFVSFYGNAAYSYDNKYTFTVSARRDASNLFGITTNEKWTPLWSAGAGWEVSKASFYHFAPVPYLKFRATYGYTGNADPSRSGVVTVFAATNSSQTGFTGYRIRQFPNPELRWEQVAITNFGFDFALRNNRISGSIEWYRKKGIDLFANSLVDQTAGISGTGIIKNVASIKGKGIDMSLVSLNTQGRFKWSTNLIFSYNTDRVTETYLSTPAATFYINDGSGLAPIKGKSIHSVLSLPWAGLDHATGNPQGYLAGKPSMDYATLTSTSITVDDLVYSGPGMPQFFGSLMNEFSYKSFSLSVNISYKLRYFFKRKPLSYVSLFVNDRKGSADFASRWQNPGDELFTDIPSLVYPLPAGRDNFYNATAAIVEKGDHIRLQFVNLSYRFPLKNKRWGMQCFINASNLGILWRANDKGLDPDYSVTGAPPSRAVAAGIKLFFQ